MRRRYKYFFSTLLALMLASFAGLATTASAQDDEVGDDELLNEFDDNEDGLLDEDEFGAGYDGFDQLDANEDGVLDNEEFGDDEEMFDNYDANDDGALGEDEFNGGTFDDMDANDDGFLDDEEFGI